MRKLVKKYGIPVKAMNFGIQNNQNLGQLTIHGLYELV